MSSLTMASRMRRLPASPPVDSSRIASSPGLRSAATSATKAAASSCSAAPKPSSSPGRALPRSACCKRSTIAAAARDGAVMSGSAPHGSRDGGGLVARGRAKASREASVGEAESIVRQRRGAMRAVEHRRVARPAATTSCTPSALRRVRTSANSSLVGKSRQRDRRGARAAPLGRASARSIGRRARAGAPCARRRPGPSSPPSAASTNASKPPKSTLSRSALAQRGGEFGQAGLVIIDAEHELDDRRHRRARLRLDPGIVEDFGIIFGHARARRRRNHRPCASAR